MAREPLVILARIRARLLGIRLLTLDAHITAASDGSPILVIPVSGQPRSPVPLPVGETRPAELARPADPADPARPARPAGLTQPDPVPGSAVAQARDLVDQGTRALDAARRR